MKLQDFYLILVPYEDAFILRIFFFKFQCELIIKEAFHEVDRLLLNKSFTMLEKDFKTCHKINSSNDVFMFVENLADPFKIAVQENTQIEGISIASVCETMTAKNRSAYDNLKVTNQVSCVYR